MAERSRTAEDVRREIEVERAELGRAVDRLRTETTDVKRQLRRGARKVVLLLALLAALVAAARVALRRLLA